MHTTTYEMHKNTHTQKYWLKGKTSKTFVNNKNWIENWSESRWIPPAVQRFLSFVSTQQSHEQTIALPSFAVFNRVAYKYCMTMEIKGICIHSTLLNTKISLAFVFAKLCATSSTIEHLKLYYCIKIQRKQWMKRQKTLWKA